MRKTGLEIESYIYGIARNKLDLRGAVYRGGTRPFDSKAEDAVVSFLSGRDGWDGFSQVGVVNVNVYVPNIPGSPYPVRDVARCEDVERMLLNLVETHEHGDYWLQTDETTQVIPDGDDFHVVNLRIKYRYNRIN